MFQILQISNYFLEPGNNQINESFNFLKLIIDLAPLIVSIIALLLSFVLSKRSLMQKEKELEQDFKLREKEIQNEHKLKEKDFKEKIREFERNEIYKKLNDFYGPLLVLRKSSIELHNTFKNGEHYRTVDALVEGRSYEGNDKVLIEEIIKIGKQCKQIVIDYAGLIDDELLRREYIPKLLNHVTIIEKAYNRELKGEVDRFHDYVFPIEIDSILDNKVTEMQERLKVLSRIDPESL